MLEFISLLSSIATMIAVILAAYQLRLNGEQIKLTREQNITTFEDDLAREYREIMKEIPIDACLGDELPEDKYQQCIDDLYRYFDLSNEQAFLHKKGRVRPETWGFWKDGIDSNLKRPAFKRAWDDIIRRSPNDFTELQDALKTTA